MDYAVNEFKALGSNPYEQYFEQVVRVLVRGDVKSITGRVISVSDKYLTLQHLDERTTLINLGDVAYVTAVAPRRTEA